MPVLCKLCGGEAQGFTHEDQRGPEAARTIYFHEGKDYCTYVHPLEVQRTPTHEG